MSEVSKGELESQTANEEVIGETELENVTGGATLVSVVHSANIQKIAQLGLFKPTLDISKIFQEVDAHRS